MRAARAGLAVVGAGFGLWGLWLMRDFTSEQLVSTGAWLIGGVILHDLVVAPVAVLVGVAAARVLPGHARSAAGVGFLVWGTLTVAFANVLSGQGGKPDNDSILDRPYVLSWLALTIAVAVAVVVATTRRRRSSAPRGG